MPRRRRQQIHPSRGTSLPFTRRLSQRSFPAVKSGMSNAILNRRQTSGIASAAQSVQWLYRLYHDLRTSPSTQFHLDRVAQL
mmetsp:Transcript_124831/g.249280  ORF Transcript_124831/g.249280 Transcript_124831/m.249280 type:complete len:82 (+) Transcript_124831:166-411(+)